jgi:hypothetical protein
MRIWIVSRDGHPAAVFLSAGSASDYASEHGDQSSFDIRWLILDAESSHVQRAVDGTHAAPRSVVWRGLLSHGLARH